MRQQKMLQPNMLQQKKLPCISANGYSRRNAVELQSWRRDVALLTQKSQSCCSTTMIVKSLVVDEAPDNIRKI